MPGIAARNASRFEGTITSHRDGTFTVLRDGESEPWPCPDSQAAELRALLRLRDTICSLLDAEKASADDTPQTEKLRARLNREYDAYTAANGPLNRASWRRTGRTDQAGNETLARQAPPQGGFRQDPYAATVYALEDFDPETGTASKAPASPCSLTRSAWAREFYDEKTAADDTHHAALRKLGNRWLEVLWHCLSKGVYYDEAVHAANRKRSRPPAAAT